MNTKTQKGVLGLQICVCWRPFLYTAALTFDSLLTYRGLVGCCLAGFGILLLLSSFREETRFLIFGHGRGRRERS